MNNPITLTEQNFEEQVLRSDIPVLVDYWAPWCGPCRMLGAVIEKIAALLDRTRMAAPPTRGAGPGSPRYS